MSRTGVDSCSFAPDGDNGEMSTRRKIAIFVTPALMLVALLIFGAALRGRKPADVTLWISMAGLIVTILALTVAWLAWLRPVRPTAPTAPPKSGTPTAPSTIEVIGDRSVGYASGSQIMTGDFNPSERSQGR